MKIEMIAPENWGEKRLLLHINGHEQMIPVQLAFLEDCHCVIFTEQINDDALDDIVTEIQSLHLSQSNLYIEFVSLKQTPAKQKHIEMRIYTPSKRELKHSLIGACIATAAVVWQDYYLYDENIKIYQNDTELMTCYLLDERILIQT